MDKVGRFVSAYSRHCGVRCQTAGSGRQGSFPACGRAPRPWCRRGQTHELCAALGGSAQGGLGLICGVAHGRSGRRRYSRTYWQTSVCPATAWHPRRFRAAGPVTSATDSPPGSVAGSSGLVDKGRVIRQGRLQCAPARCWQPPYPCRRSALPAAPASEAVLRISSCGKGTPLVSEKASP